MQSIQDCARSQWNTLPGMNSDVLALCLSIALALTKTIENLMNGTLSGYNLSVTLILSLAFWFTARHACDVLTRKEYIRTLSERRLKMIYVYRDKQPIKYFMHLLGHLFVSVSTALVVLFTSTK